MRREQIRNFINSEKQFSLLRDDMRKGRGKSDEKLRKDRGKSDEKFSLLRNDMRKEFSLLRDDIRKGRDEVTSVAVRVLLLVGCNVFIKGNC